MLVNVAVSGKCLPAVFVLLLRSSLTSHTHFCSLYGHRGSSSRKFRKMSWFSITCDSAADTRYLTIYRTTVNQLDSLSNFFKPSMGVLTARFL